jgi:hypothetical protein
MPFIGGTPSIKLYAFNLSYTVTNIYNELKPAWIAPIIP